MEMYQNILVVVDPIASEQKALKRAVDLVSRLQESGEQVINITAFFSIFDFSYEMTTILSSNERDTMRQMVINEKEQWLDDIISVTNSQIKITSKTITIASPSVLNTSLIDASMNSLAS